MNILTDVNARFGATFFSLDLDEEFDDVEYDLDLDLQTFPISIDWYPFDESFHITGGIIINETDIRLDATPTASVTIGDTLYQASDFGSLRGEAEFNRVAPYIGIGWGNAFGTDRRWGFMADLGVAFIGSPDVSLTARTEVALPAGFPEDLQKEEDEIEDDLEDFKFYPVLSLSLFFRF